MANKRLQKRKALQTIAPKKNHLKKLVSSYFTFLIILLLFSMMDTFGLNFYDITSSLPLRYCIRSICVLCRSMFGRFLTCVVNFRP